MLLYKGGLQSCVQGAHIAKENKFDFSKNTTYGLGGFADVAYYPKTVFEAKIAYDELKSNKIPITVIGNGSNVLASDNGVGGAVISTKKLEGIVRLSKDRLLCLAGTKIARLLEYCRKNELGGLEYLYAIPATVGGAAYMNAGVCGISISQNIESVHVYDGKSTVLPNEKCDFGYRHSTMRNISALILSIIVKVNSSCAAEIDERIRFYRERRAHLPKGKSCGCVFKNPEGFSAGYLIESAGLKGLRIGGAAVSDRHASFIINEGGKADDVKRLIETVKKRVFERFAIALSEEVVYIGEF